MSPKEFGLLHFLGQVTAGLTTLDGKLLGSLRRLFFRPGALTSDWVRGARVRHLRPFQLFLLVNLVVVILGKWLDLPGTSITSFADAAPPWHRAMQAQAAQLGLTEAAYQNLYGAKSAEIARNTIVVLVAAVALISAVLHLRSDRRIGVHLVFATHLVAFFLLVPDLLVMCFLLPWVRSLVGSSWNEVASYLLLVPFIMMVVWWFLATRRVFGSRRGVALAQSALGGVLFWLVGMLFHQYVIFKWTLRALAE